MSTTNTVLDPASDRGSLLVNNIEVGGEPLPNGSSAVLGVTISNNEGQHEVATVTVKLQSTTVNKLKDSKTIAFTYGSLGKSSVFYGYTQAIAASKAYQQDGTYELRCFGTTSTLQDGAPRFFSRQTAPQMVADIVKGHGLGVQVDDHPFVFPTYAQTDQTDWAIIKEIAGLVGCVLYNYSGVVRMVNPLRLLTETAPVLRLIRGEQSLDASNQLLEFMPGSESQTIASLLTPVFSYFDGTTVSLSAPLDKTHRLYTDSPTLNKAMADVATRSWTDSTVSWSQSATGRIAGNPSVIPGSVVSVRTNSSKVIDHDYDGLWLVRQVEHHITASGYQTGFLLGRPEVVPTNTNTDYKPFWSISPNGRPQVVKNADVWESSWKTVSTVSSQLSPDKAEVSNTTWKVS